MAEDIRIKKKSARRGDDGHNAVSVRLRDELIERLDALAEAANRSRNEIINLFLESAVDFVKIEDQFLICFVIKNVGRRRAYPRFLCHSSVCAKPRRAAISSGFSPDLLAV